MTAPAAALAPAEALANASKGPYQMTAPAEGCHVALLSPLEIHFSQTRISLEFQDGRALEETVTEIKAVPPNEAPEEMLNDVEDVSETCMLTANSGGEDVSETCMLTANSGGEEQCAAAEQEEDDAKKDVKKDFKDFRLLLVPFPMIEVIRWRCKLREPNGAPKVDPSTGLELYSTEERWFTFDNRRLYCLQKAAMAQWPIPVRIQVITVPMKLAKTRELRKFDTKTYGCRVAMGRREEENLPFWSWRAVAGLPEEEQPENGVGRQAKVRWRGKGPRGDGRNSGSSADKDGGNSMLEMLHSALLFFLVYLSLRLAFSVGRHYLKDTGLGDQQQQQPPL